MTITQADIDRLHWFHSFDFPGGLSARSGEPGAPVNHRVLWQFMTDHLKTLTFHGKSVIDIGCWDGYFTFLTEKLGAASVLAVDDASQNWGSQECFRLAHALFGSRAEYRPDVSAYEVGRRVQRQFDIVLFMGVYYHLLSPYNALAEIRALCHDDTVVIIEGLCLRDDQHAYAQIPLPDPKKSVFIPTTRLLVDMLRSCYFTVERMEFLGDRDVQALLQGVTPNELLTFVAQRVRSRRVGRQPAVAADAEIAANTPAQDRVMIFARPFTGRNTYHMYRPPFGSDRYDVPGAFDGHR